MISLIKKLIALFIILILYFIFWTLNYSVHVIGVVFRSRIIIWLSEELDRELVYYCRSLQKWSKK